MNIYLGIDIGSVSTNVIAIDENTEVIFDRYIRTGGQPINSVKEGMAQLKESIQNSGYTVAGVGVTGSGRQMIGLMVGADVVKNEITAHATATIYFHPNVQTIFEIGGQDSKIIIIKNGIVTDFSMNTICAAGTGSFLDHQAERLQVPIQEFGEMALSAKNNVRIAGRCTVFAESDMIAKQQYGYSKAEIIKGLCDALVRNYLNNLGRGKTLKPPFVFQGGVAANKGIVRAFEEQVGEKIIIPKYFNVMGAIGVAIMARSEVEKAGAKTKFKGFDCIDLDFTPKSFECHGCSNACEVIKVVINGETVAMWGDKCGKWGASIT